MLEQPCYELQGVDAVLDLVEEFSWVTLVSHLPSGLVVSHLPVLPDRSGSDVAVLGHLARADAEQHELGEHDVVVVVQGPHGYVSPAFYAGGPYVPTWNFVVVHLHGRPQVLSADETYAVLDRTVDHYEHQRPEPFRLDSVDEYARRIAPQTTGFRLVPSRVVAKAKLSQDKPEADRLGVVRGLEHDPVHGNPALARYMRARGVVR